MLSCVFRSFDWRVFYLGVFYLRVVLFTRGRWSVWVEGSAAFLVVCMCERMCDVNMCLCVCVRTCMYASVYVRI